jgi:hypothetical protein
MFVPSQKAALLFDVRRDSPGWFPYGTAALSRALCKQPHLFFEGFPYARPEPVLVK